MKYEMSKLQSWVIKCGRVGPSPSVDSTEKLLCTTLPSANCNAS